jgi:BASS family bile acid:Na+ symporter
METLILLMAQAAIVLTVFALGLSASPQDAIYLFRRPGQLLRSLLSMNVVMPLFAAAVNALFELRPAVEIALITLAVSPVPPLLPNKVLKAGGGASYTIGLLVAAALLAIVFVPLIADLVGSSLGRPAQMSPIAIAKVVGITVLAPLAVGMLVRRVAPGFSERIAKPISMAASILLVISLLPILFIAMPTIVSLVGNGTLAAVVAFVILGLAAGHLLGGPEPQHRTVLALATSSRHPGIAVAIASVNFPEEEQVFAAILLYLLVNAIVSVPYVIWRSRRHK